MNKYILGSLLIGTTLLGCLSEDDPNSIGFFRIISGSNSLEIESSKRLTAFTNQERFDEGWRRVLGGEPSVINFNMRTAVIAEMGTQTGTGVPHIGVTSVVVREGFTEVIVTSFIPEAGCSEDAALSSPFSVMTFESTQPIIFKEQVDIVQCY